MPCFKMTIALVTDFFLWPHCHCFLVTFFPAFNDSTLTIFSTLPQRLIKLITVKKCGFHEVSAIFVGKRETMQAPETTPNEQQEDSPPIFKSWNQLYIFVLVLHALLITMFYIFTHTYS